MCGCSSLRGLSLPHHLLLLLGLLSVCGAQSIQPSAALPMLSDSDDVMEMMMMDTETFLFPTSTVQTNVVSATLMDVMSSADVMSSSVMMATPIATPVETPSPSPDVTSIPPLISTPVVDVTETPTTPPETTTPTTTTTTQAPDPSSSSGLSQGAIIGIAAGGGVVALLVLLAALCCCCYCCCCRTTSKQEYTTGNEGIRPHIVVRTYNQNVERAGSLISRGSRGSLARSSISSIASSLRRLSGRRRSKTKDSHFVNEEAVAMKVTPL